MICVFCNLTFGLVVEVMTTACGLAGMNELKEREHSLTNQLEETRHAYEHEKGIISSHVFANRTLSCLILISHVLQEFISSPVFVCTQVSYRQ